MRKLSDLICTEHRLSVIENPARHGMSYNKWLGEENRLSGRDMLRMAIDQAVQKRPKDMDGLIKLLEKSGYTVKRGKYLAFRAEGQKQFIRLRSLGDGYSEEDLRAVLKNEKPHTPFTNKKYPKSQQRTIVVFLMPLNLASFIDIFLWVYVKVIPCDVSDVTGIPVINCGSFAITLF